MSNPTKEATTATRDIMMRHRTLALTGDINPESTGDILVRMIELQGESSSPINLIIDTNGGQTDYALQLCDFMSLVIKAPIRGIALGACGSAATFILLHCNERLCTPNTRFSVHTGTRSGISVNIEESAAKKLKQLLKSLRENKKVTMGIYMDKLTPPAWEGKIISDKKKRKFVQKLVDRGDQTFNSWMSATEAIEAGLVTSIVRENLEIFQ